MFSMCSFLRGAGCLLWQLKFVGAVCAQRFGRKTACARGELQCSEGRIPRGGAVSKMMLL